MSKTHTEITVFYGDQLVHAHERRAINAVREELSRRRIPARLLVNFTVSNGGRQVDLVIVTDQRCMNVELKSLTPTLPLVGTPNGFWSQRLPDGSERKMDRNFYTQARDQTYGISDAMDALAKKGRVPSPRHDRFFKHIDTVVCIDPRIPPGSTVQKLKNVSVVGLDTLVDRLVRPGPGLPHWESRHWDEFIRYLGLYAEGDDAPEELRRRADAAAVEDYRRRFREFTAAGLPPLIPASALIAGLPGTVDADAMADLLTPQQRVLLLGASGNGKSHLAGHTSLALSDSGQMVLWLPADDYEKDQLDRSLARAVGPFSTEKAEALLAKADEGGAGMTVIIDALEKCRHRVELLRQIHTMQRQYAISVLVTTARDVDTEPLCATDRLELTTPTGEERAVLATTYGTSDGVANSDEYRTRYDISLAAQVITELPAGASTTDVFDAYVRRRTQTETVRAGLRVLAHTMDAGVRTALPVSEARFALRRPFATTPSAIDDTLTSQLVSIHQGRLRFNHERLGRFLAAEHLVLTAVDGTELAQLLAEPTHRDLRDYALELERDPARRYAAIRHLGDAQMIADAVRGKYGAHTAGQSLTDITELLIQAASTAHQATFSVEDPEKATHFDGTWNTGRHWTPIERALLSASGHCVHDGLFLDEVGALMDSTDTAMRAAMAQLYDAGNKTSISTVVGSTFGPIGRGATMAANLVVVAAEYSRIFDRASTRTATATATPMWRPNPRCFGRMYMAALLSHTARHPDDADNLPELVNSGLSLGGYHLRLQLLQAAQFASSILESDVRQRMIGALESYEPAPNDWGSSSLRIEALASYDQITPVTTLEDIQESIVDVIGDENNPDHHRLAQGIVSRMFEDERVLGPYSEAIGTLPERQRLTLFAMSMLAPDHCFASSYVMRELADAASSSKGIIGRALAAGAGAVPDDTVFPQEVVAAHLYALQGWAKVAPAMPPAEASGDPLVVAWRLVDELLLALFRGDNRKARAEVIWRQLITEMPIYATAVLHDIHSARMVHSGKQEGFVPYHTLLTAYPDQVRLLLEWALPRRDKLDLPHRHAVWNLGRYLIHALGEVGTTETADLLRTHYVHDSELGHDAVDAVRTIDSRTQM